MALKLMYITNQPEIAQIAETAGVDRIFVDLEYIGKGQRQGGMDTVQSHHVLEDVKRISNALTTAELLVRVNPIHDKTDAYCSSEEEILPDGRHRFDLAASDGILYSDGDTMLEVKYPDKDIRVRVKLR